MKRISILFIATILVLSLIVPSCVLAAGGVPAQALKARESVFRVLCADAQYTYSGSSFVVGADDRRTYLVTNYHVIEDANQQSITVVERDGTELSVDVVGYDADHDLCILQTEKPIKGAAIISIMPEGAAAGDAVYALGYPGAGDYLLDDYAYSVEDITVTDGIISAVKTVTTGAKRTTFLQMNAAINPGSSGGPLVNGEGQVVGINTLYIQQAQNVFAAVSSQHILKILQQYAIPFQSVGQTGEQAAARPDTPLFVWLAIGAVAALILIGVIVLIGRARRLTLAVLLSRRLQGYSFEEALLRLSPVFHTLSQLHVRAEAHGSISPANIYVHKSGDLHLGGGRRKCILSENTKAYIPMEQYENPLHAYTYSDIYALGAVVFAMIACAPPPDVMTRLQDDTLEERLNSIQGLPHHLRQTILKAMALKKEERLHDMGQFLRAAQFAPHDTHCPQPQEPQQAAFSTIKQEFSVQQAAFSAFEQEISPQQQPAPADLPMESTVNTPNMHWYDAPGLTKHASLPVAAKRKRKILVFSCVGTVLLSMAALLIINETNYRRAVTCSESTDFLGASEAVSNTFLFYRDATTLTDYISAGRYLQVNRYQEAKDQFLALGDYRNAKNMALECDYQHAHSLLDSGELKSAKDMFVSLKSYSDSQTMVKECDYRQAVLFLSQAKYTEAKVLFTKLAKDSYRNSQTLSSESDYRHAKKIYDKFVESDSAAREMQPIQLALILFESLGNYSDSAEMLEEVKNEVYLEAKSLFQSNLTNGYQDVYHSWTYFSMIENYLDSALYIRIYDTICNDELSGSHQYSSLMQSWDSEPVQQVILSDLYISNFLAGTWKGDGCYFKITEKADGSFPCTYDFPWRSREGYYKIENLVFYLNSKDNEWEKEFAMIIMDKDIIMLFSYKDGKVYTIVRQ